MDSDTDYSISKTTNKIMISLKTTSCIFLQSIYLLLGSKGAIINSLNTNIYFYGDTFQPLRNITMTYDLTIHMCSNLTAQILYLEEHGNTFIGLDINDIWVFGDTFVLINPRNVVAFNKNTSQIVFVAPFVKPAFLSDEVDIVKLLPSSVSYLVGRTAIAKLCIGILGLDKTMDTIMNTRLYWFLKRCLLNPVDFILI